MSLGRGACLLLMGLFVMRPLMAAPLLYESEDYYDIEGHSAQQLREQMNNVRPMEHGQRFDAYTEWYVKWHFDFQNTAQGCELTESKVSVDIVYHLPRWANEESAAPELQRHWNSYFKHLLLHERGHAQNGKKAATEIADMLKNLAPFSSCPLLEQMANERAQQIIAEHNAWDLEYDKETRHGRTQGATFP